MTALAVLALTALAHASAAMAAPPQLSVQAQGADGAPVSYLVVDAAAGQPTRAGQIVVENDDRRAVTVDVDTVSAVTAENLGSAYALRSDEERGAATWLRAPQTRLTLAPGQSEVIDVFVEPPEGADPGEYLAGMAIEARGQRANPGDEGDVAIVSAQRYVVGVQVNVGELRVPRLVFDGALIERRPAGLTFLVEMRNAGSAILDVRGQVVIERDGRRVAAAGIGPGTFVTDSSIDFPVVAPRENPPEGTEYRVRAVARYDGRVVRLDETVEFGSRAAERQERFGGRPAEDGGSWLPLALGALVALLLLGLALWAWRRRSGGLPGRAETIAAIERNLDAAAAGGPPLAVVAVGPMSTDPRHRQSFEDALQAKLRRIDELTEPERGTLIVIAPDRNEHGASTLLEDLHGVAREHGEAVAVRARIATPPAVAEAVLDALLAEPAGNGRPPGA